MASHEHGNLPLELTSFVGRRREVAELKRLLSVSRLVTLTGVGGVGKTRLAQHTAAGLRRAFEDGVWFVELSSLTDPDLLAETVTVQLGVRAETTGDHLAALAAWLVDRHVLIVLDNCEHLLPASAVLADRLIKASTGAHVLATSRQPLGLTAEHILTVAPLAVPDFNTLPDVRMVAQYEAVALFTDRARAAEPSFSLTPDNAEAVAQLCARLDGLPLAIELAAVRLRALSPSQILARLDERYSLLRAESTVTEPRQQTLRALVDWSYGLCTGPEQKLWARVSVFNGGFDLEAAEGVCADDALPEEQVVGVIADLIEKSIIARSEIAGQARYQLYATIRDYGRRALAESGQESEFQTRHLDYFAQLGERWEVQWFSASDAVIMQRLQVELPNLRLAMERGGAEPATTQRALRLASALWLSWRAAGLIAEGRRWLDHLLALDDQRTSTRAKALWANGWLAGLQGDLERSQALLDDSGALGEALEDKSVAAYVAQFSGHLAMSSGQVARAAQLLEFALTAHRAAGNRVGTAITLIRLALSMAALGDVERARDLAVEYLELADENHSEWLSSFGNWAFSVTMWLSGEVGEAEARARTNVHVDWTHVGQLTTAFSVEVLAWTAAALGRADRSARLLGGLERVWKPVGAPLPGYAFLVVHHDECLAQARRVLGERAFQHAFDQGSKLSFDELLAYTLDRSGDDEVPTHLDSDAATLTKREREVADCVSQGLSNREIARSLVISERTAEGHVQHILVKLGFTSRAQIAAWFAGRNEPSASGERSS
jgi:predicted ATPase/DNA-binding CsgD family transcriptional regulator